MSYIPFVQKYRPTRFSELVGQSHVASILQSAFRENSIAPAYLFSGPHGIGKTSTARIFAKLINCEAPEGIEPCNRCHSCIDISSGRSMDVIEIDAASNRRIDEVRQLRENVKFAPVKTKYKVYIIDEVHMLTLEAFNALLKTLEEPPDYVRFILATTHPHKLPPTILSRCQRIEFTRPDREQIRAYLDIICEGESLEIEPQVLDFISRKANGSMRDAGALLEQVAVVSMSNEISWEDIISILDTGIDSGFVLDLIRAVIDRDVVEIVKLVDTVIKQGIDIAGLLSSIEEIFRALLLGLESVPEELWNLDNERKDFVRFMLDRINKTEAFYILQVLIKMKEWVSRGILDRLALELGFIKMAERANFVPLQQAYGGATRYAPGNRGQQSIASGQDSSLLYSDRQSKSTPIPKEIHPKAERPASQPDFWRRIIADLVRSKNMFLAHILQDIWSVQLQGDTLNVVFVQKFSYESMKDNKNLSVFRELITRELGKGIRFKFSFLNKSKSDTSDPAFEEKINMALDTFGGKVVERGRLKE